MSEYGLDQKALVQKTGLTQATISRYTLGKAVPTGENLGILADVFDVSVDYLLGRTNIREVNRKIDTGTEFEVLAAHKSDSNEDVKNIPGLKDLLREIVKEELGK